MHDISDGTTAEDIDRRLWLELTAEQYGLVRELIRLEADAPYHASQMFSRNLTNLMRLLTVDGQLTINRQDEIVASTLVTHGGQVVHPRLCELLGRQVPAD